MPFYKQDNDELICAPNRVSGPDFELLDETHEDNTYPINGWYWFDNINSAFIGLAQHTVPEAVTMRQARLALLGAGLLDAITNAIESLPSPQKEYAKISWEYSQEVQRYNGFVSTLAPALGLTENDIDALFLQAKTL